MWRILWILFYFPKHIFTRFEGSLNYTIQENLPSGTQVGYITSDIAQNSIYNHKKFFDSTSTFIFRDQNEYFNLDKKTSVLKTGTKIDLEALCPKYCNEAGIGFLNLVVNIWKENHLRGVINVKIMIHDQNDNVPKFPMKVFEKKIKEILYGVGKLIELPKAVDKDVTEIYSRVSYKLSKSSDTFELQVTKDNYPSLRLTKDIDFETKSSYDLTLMAWNPGQEDLISYLEIKIEIIDMNDCEPVFAQNIIRVVLDENTKVGKIILKLEATDKDKISKLTYGIASSAKPIDTETFAVKESGEVILTKKLDMEIQSAYEIPVYATDGEFSANAKLNVLVQDVNNHPPYYNLNPTTLNIEENQPPNILVGQIIVKDVDAADVNGVIRCQEPSGKSNLQDLRFSPNPADHPLTLKYDMYSRISLDREEASTRIIYLICHDGGLHERLTSTMTISLQVLDVNDNPPIFSQSVYKAEIKENNTMDAKVIKVSAHDKDDKENAIINYSILEGPDSNIFAIDLNTGWIKVMRELDREEKDKYSLNIIAFNKSPKIIFNATSRVDIIVLDINDNKPNLMPPSQFEIMENSKPSVFIGNIISEDKDSGNNGKLVFGLINSNLSNYFELKRNGSLYSKVTFDREIQERYCLNIRVNDLGVPTSLSVTGTICILILDDNDNVPVISIVSDSDINGMRNTSRVLNNDVIILSVYENPGYKVASIVGHDADKDLNAKINFNIEDFNHAAPFFIIDEEDGSIKLSRVMSRDLLGDYKIKVVAYDKGKQPLKAEKTITIQIQDIPSQTPNPKPNIQITGNVLIVIILSTISAFLTALLIGAILCMIRPCCQSTLSQSNYQIDSNISNGQSLLQKLPPPYYNMNTYGPFEPSFDSSWNQTLNRNDRLCSNVTLDCYENNLLEKSDYMGYDTPRLYMSQNTLCHVDHVVGKLNGCSCGRGACVRYSTHPNPNCLSPNPEEQCSDSGRGASDDDMKALNLNGSSASSSRPTISVYGTYTLGDSRSRSPRQEGFLNMNPDHMRDPRRMQINSCQTGFIVPFSAQSTQIPLSTFHTLLNSETQLKSSNQRSSLLNLAKSSSIDSLSNIPNQNSNLPSPSNVDRKNSQLLNKKINSDVCRNL